jgi:hypothetical protein
LQIQNEIGDAMDYLVQHYYQGQSVLQQAMDNIQIYVRLGDYYAKNYS